jgi:glutamate-1-semialdehyde 2,1-aminomutase
MVAGLATLDAYQPPEIERINRLGDLLRARLATAARERSVALAVTGVGSLVGVHLAGQPVTDYRSALPVDRDAMHWLHLALLNRGVFMRAAGGCFLSTAMTETEIDRAAELFGGALDDVAPLLPGGGS